jgi:hypothetical protein
MLGGVAHDEPCDRGHGLIVADSAAVALEEQRSPVLAADVACGVAFAGIGQKETGRNGCASVPYAQQRFPALPACSASCLSSMARRADRIAHARTQGTARHVLLRAAHLGK